MVYAPSAPPRRLLGAALVLGLFTTADSAAQEAEPILSTVEVGSGSGAWRTSPADSTRRLAAARSAQRRFELIRRNHLPWAWDRGGGDCDERIGRFCLWYGSGESTWQPPPDPEPTVVARQDLIARLDTAAAVIPGDWWVAGQRVRYLVEAGKFDDARAAARACRSHVPGWCDALLGFALHRQGEFVPADSAFDAALAAMPPRERERWTDLAVLLEHGDARAYRRLSDTERASFEARFWWLADPLFMVPGNDRRTEHFSRHVIDRLQDRARQTEGISWGSDLREILLRFGTPAGWERMRPRTPSHDGTSMVTRYPSGSRHFDPSGDFVRNPLGIADGDWDLNPRAARTSYAPAYAAPVEVPEFQVARFQRGDSAVVASALRLAPDSLDVRHAAEFALVVWPDERAAPRLVGQEHLDSVAVLSATVAAVPTLISAEALAREPKRAARVRFALDLGPLPEHGLAASDLLLLRSADVLPDSLAAAIPAMRASTSVQARERIGVFWELYGLSEPDLPLSTSVQLVDESAGLLRRFAERIRVLQPQTPLNVRWQEAPSAVTAVFARSLAIEIPDLRPGEYSLQLTLTPRGRDPIVVRRSLTVVASPAAD